MDTSIVLNPSILANDDLIEEYGKLSKIYLNLKVQIDVSAQENYELKRKMELVVAREQCLNDELQAIADNFNQDLSAERKKFSDEADDLRTRLKDAKTVNEELQEEIEQMKHDRDALKTNLDGRISIGMQQVFAPTDTVISNSRLEYLERLEFEHNDLTVEMDGLKLKCSEITSQLAQAEVK